MLQRGLTSKETQRSLSLECKALRDLVAKLRQDMLLCKDETQKVKDQLQCLIYLVRRSWSGDNIAAIHVANIVGVAPPSTFIQKKDQENLKVFPKPDPVNNWARLCVGILNKMYREEELELRASQLMYLQDREGYLDDELASHSDVMRHQSNMALLKTNTFQLLQAKEEEERRERQEKLDKLEKQKHELQLQHRRQHPPHSHLYRKPSRDSIQQTTELSTEDALFVRPAARSTSRPTSGVKKKQQLILQETSDFSDELEEAPNNAPIVDTDVGLTTKTKTFNLFREEAEVTNTDKTLKKHTRARTADGLNTNKPWTTKSPDKSSTARSGSRPVSAHNLTRPKTTKQSTTNGRATTQSGKTRRHLDLIEKDLKLTTKTLQDRLGISKQGMV